MVLKLVDAGLIVVICKIEGLEGLVSLLKKK